ncbi:hypothetical protein EGR_10873 [Echinococcus granulosus]|uniref:Uncharacterized protein n=1 Tax=Echinococcus granulosus TaxID=6210 RepID=W6U1A2_ECHGR|nr:hypothetical protein EGR_10873 [Echinococcus granulosus]EUB54271.1 hypothetical protein EGR_10873 [Echinococcus granulosus]
MRVDIYVSPRSSGFPCCFVHKLTHTTPIHIVYAPPLVLLRLNSVCEELAKHHIKTMTVEVGVKEDAKDKANEVEKLAEEKDEYGDECEAKSEKCISICSDMLAAASVLKVTMSIQTLGISTPPHMLTYTYSEGITAAVVTYDGSGMRSAGFGGDGASRVFFGTIIGKRVDGLCLRELTITVYSV